MMDFSSMASLPLFDMVKAFFFAFLATVSFGVLFQCPRKMLWPGGFIGGVGWVVFAGLRSLSVHSFSANFVATVCISLLSELAARKFHEPVTVFNIPAIIPLVPGLGMYRGMHFILEDVTSYGTEVLLNAVLDACAIALGIMMVAGVFRALKTSRDWARYKTEDTLGTSISPALYVLTAEEEEERNEVSEREEQNNLRHEQERRQAKKGTTSS
ncbi:MAG: threonine/serine exporter family protein [Succiniclasticum sp.]|jgi:uncharacterized membrane protein YjjB (DUF3815 family)